jgi:hypothetical protein
MLAAAFANVGFFGPNVFKHGLFACGFTFCEPFWLRFIRTVVFAQVSVEIGAKTFFSLALHGAKISKGPSRLTAHHFKQ